METENTAIGNDSDGDDEFRRQKYKMTMELPLFLTMLGIIVAGEPTSNLIMYRTCVHSLNHSVEECQSFLLPESINHTQQLETEVQHYATFVTTVRTVLQSIVPAVMTVLIGVWSDKHGRKPLITWPLFGMFVSSVMIVTYSMLQSLGPWWVIATVVPNSLSGGFAVLYIGCMCYASDTSTTENRTLRIMYIKLACTLASALGSSLSPYLLKGLGNVTYLLLTETTLYAIAYAYSAIFLRESLSTATPGTLVNVLNITHVKEMFHVCFKKKPNYGRAIILLVAASSSLFVFAVYGIAGLKYLYTRNKIHMTMKDYTTYKSISTAMWFLGSIFAVSVVQRVFRISDISFALIAYMGCILEYLIEGLATTTWHMYLGSAVSFFGATSGTFIRSFLTKVLPSTDIAKVFALLGSEEAVSPLVAPVLYNMLYVYTIDSCPGAFMFLSVAFTVISFVLLAIIPCLQRKSSSVSYQIIEEDTGIMASQD